MTPGPWYPLATPNEDGGVWIDAPHVPDGAERAVAYVTRPEDAAIVAAAPVLLVTLGELVRALATNPDAVNKAFHEARALYMQVVEEAGL